MIRLQSIATRLAGDPVAEGARPAGDTLVRRVAGRVPAALLDVAFLAFAGAIAFTRWTVLRPYALPTGADGGNWLALGRALGHQAAMPGGVVYPPLVPAIALAVDLLGKPIAGLKLVAVLASVVPAVGCYAAARLMGMRRTAVVPCAFLAVVISVSEAAAWGGYPQLLGLGLLPVALALLDRALRDWRVGTAALAGVALAATLSANELVGVAALLAAALLAAIHLVVLGARPPTAVRFAAVLAAVAAPSLLLAPVYVPLVSAVWATRGVKPKVGDLALRDFVPYIYRDLPVFWYPVQLLAAAAPAAWFLNPRDRSWPAVTSLLVADLALLVVLRQVRFGYVLPVVAVLGLAAWLDALRAVRPRFPRLAAVAAPVATLALLPVLADQAVASVPTFRDQAAFYHVVPDDWVGVLAYLREDTAAGSVVAVGPDARLDPTGWWVQGLGQRPALVSSDPAWMSFPDERARAARAQWIFDPGIGVAGSLRRARALGVSYLVVDKRWPAYQAWFGPGTGVHVVLDEPDVALVRV